MWIRVRRTGGFAGIERHAEVDTEGLPDATEWHTLAERAMATCHPTPPAGVPDGFGYQITVNDKTAYTADPHLTEAQRTLISRVLKEGA